MKRFAFVIDNGEPTFYDLSEDGEIMNVIDTEEMLNELDERNKQLIEFKNKTFNLINEKIRRGEQAIEWGESVEADTRAMSFHIELLKMLKKELFTEEDTNE